MPRLVLFLRNPLVQFCVIRLKLILFFRVGFDNVPDTFVNFVRGFASVSRLEKLHRGCMIQSAYELYLGA